MYNTNYYLSYRYIRYADRAEEGSVKEMPDHAGGGGFEKDLKLPYSAPQIILKQKRGIHDVGVKHMGNNNHRCTMLYFYEMRYTK